MRPDVVQALDDLAAGPRRIRHRRRRFGGGRAAVRRLGTVLHDARRRYGDDDPHVVELRREIALLDPNG